MEKIRNLLGYTAQLVSDKSLVVGKSIPKMISLVFREWMYHFEPFAKSNPQGLDWVLVQIL